MEVISASDHLYWRMIRQGFSKIRHSNFQESPFRLLICLKMPSPCSEITSYGAIPVAKLSGKRAGGRMPGGPGSLQKEIFQRGT